MSLNIFTDSSIGILKDPFRQECIDQVHFFMIKSCISGNATFTAIVKFKNDNTQGEQKFTGNSFDDLGKQVNAFIQTLTK